MEQPNEDLRGGVVRVRFQGTIHIGELSGYLMDHAKVYIRPGGAGTSYVSFPFSWEAVRRSLRERTVLQAD